jgi:thioredoxin reductase
VIRKNFQQGGSSDYSGLSAELINQPHVGAAENGNLEVDDHQRTTIDGFYAAGDVVTDLHQLSVAFGHAAIAATDMHNRLPPNPR